MFNIVKENMFVMNEKVGKFLYVNKVYKYKWEEIFRSGNEFEKFYWLSLIV